MVLRKKLDITFDSFSVFKDSSFSRRYHACKDRWQPTVGDDSLHCGEENDNEHKHAVAIIYDSFHSNKFVGLVPLYWNELANKYFKFPNHHIRVVLAKE